MADWTTISSLATAGGTLVPAIATYSAVRSSNRLARIAERAIEVGMRPVIMSSRIQDPPEKIGWQDDHRAKVPGGGGYAEEVNGIIYLAASLRNAGSGIAVIQGWWPVAEWLDSTSRRATSASGKERSAIATTSSTCRCSPRSRRGNE